MKKNPLSVWTLSYRPSYYITHPWKLFKDIYWNWRNFWHRGRYGYAYVDVWNFCDWYPRVAAEALRYMAEHGHGYPGVKPWETPEKWREYLNYLANRLQRCADSQDILWGQERNEYLEKFNEIMENTRVWKEDEKGHTVLSHRTLTPEEEEYRKKYFMRMDELLDADRAYDIDTFRWIGEDIRRLWD